MGLKPVSAGLWVLVGLGLVVVWSYPQLVHLWRASTRPAGEMAPDCNPELTACPVHFEDGTEVSLRIETSTLPRRKRHFAFRLSSPLEPTALELTGVEMNMGLFRLPMHAGATPETWTSTAPLPLCTLKTMQWRAEIVFPDRSARFTFVSRR